MATAQQSEVAAERSAGSEDEPQDALDRAT